MLDKIQWLGHGSFVIQGPPLIYIDPWRVVKSVFHADVILISHDHYDHFSPADIDKLRGPETRIICNAEVAKQVENATILLPWQSITIDQTSIKAVPAYSPDDLRHPREAGGLGFVISINYYDIYYAGDTMYIPEMKLIRPDIAIVPIDNNGTMNPEEAAEVVRQMQPRYAIPSNWGSTISESATQFDVRRFEKAVGDATQVIVPASTG